MKKEVPEELKKYKMYTLAELEPILGVSHRTMMTYVKDGRLAAVKIGGKWRVSEEALKNLVKGK